MTSSRPRILCVGSHLESEIALQGLISAAIELVGLVTLDPAAAAGISDYRDLRPLCRRAALPWFETHDINSPATLEWMRKRRPDYIFTLGWNRLFRRELLRIPSGYVVGSHPTPLPEGRGRAPIPWTILLDRRRSASTLFRMTLDADDGEILVQKPFVVGARSYAMEVYQRAAECMRDGFIELAGLLERGEAPGRPQPAVGVTHYARRRPEDGRIEFSAPADWIERLVRAVSRPYPGAYTYHDGRKVEVWRASFGPDGWFGQPGQIVHREEGRLLVTTGDRALWLEELTIDGNPTDGESFPIGTKFGYAAEDEIHRLWQAIETLKKERP